MENELPKVNINDCVEIKPTHIKQSIYTEIGYPFRYKGETYVTVNCGKDSSNQRCSHCAFGYTTVSSCWRFNCIRDNRKDGNYVMYEKVKTDK